jgi:hypothetical protein
MVRVKGQLDAPLVNMEAMQQEYWERQEVTLPSLAKLHKPKGWRRWFYKEQAPKVVLQRLADEDWHKIQAQFHDLQQELLKDQPKTNDIASRALKGEPLTQNERIFITDADNKARPITYTILSKMIIEPKVTYDDVVLMFEFLDDYDENTLLAFVNQMTSEKASVMNQVMKERSIELQEINAELRASI